MWEDLLVTRRPLSPILPLMANQVEADASGADADAGGAAGDDDQSSAQDEGTLDAADEGADESARSAADDDDENDEVEFEATDAEGNPLPQEEQFKRMRRAFSQMKKRLSRSHSDRLLLKQLRDRNIPLERLIGDARSLAELREAAKTNPARVRQILALEFGEDDDQPARRTSRRAADRSEEDEFTFDDSPEALGFDKNEHRANATIAQYARTAAEALHLVKRLQQQVAQLPQRVDRIEGETRAQGQRALVKEWETAYNAAAPHIKDPAMRDVFVDLVKAAFRFNAGKRPAQEIVDHYLRKLKIDPSGKASAASAAAARTAANRATHRVAQHVAQLPRTPMPGTPAPAGRKTELLADVHKRVRTARSA